ncbi:hypothetical protein L6452_41916 [Arctium lappa]|uniref:Uncharacterized protein n=1 Tax=Arctium lappa TaxID=4217 RepID=A0ACB8XI04_ARCLA|nr:hypothetical protein L6452_41916 [Arctium lappa]
MDFHSYPSYCSYKSEGAGGGLEKLDKGLNFIHIRGILHFAPSTLQVDGFVGLKVDDQILYLVLSFLGHML